jgi:hypothetical protein
MSDLMMKLFGPLSESYCTYFLIVSAVFLVAFSIMFFAELRYIVLNYNKLNFRVLFSGILILFNMFLAYLMNRLFYTMCVRAH